MQNKREEWSQVKSLTCVLLFPAPWTIACQAPPSMGFCRQEDWSGWPFPSPRILPTQGSNPGLPHCRQTLYQLSHQEIPSSYHGEVKIWNSSRMVKNLPESACKAGDLGSMTGSERSAGEGNDNPLQYSFLENPVDRGAWQPTVIRSRRVGHDWANSILPFCSEFYLPTSAIVIKNWKLTLLIVPLPFHSYSFENKETDFLVIISLKVLWMKLVRDIYIYFLVRYISCLIFKDNGINDFHVKGRI